MKKIFLLLIITTTLMNAQIKAFPTAYGGGAYATGGRGGEVYHVTTLNDGGAGSFRDAVSQSNRTIVFDVSGVIELQGNLYIDESNLTIAGQSAPQGGITITMAEGANIGFEYKICENNIMRFIRVRGNFNGGRNTFRVYPSSATDTRYSRNHIFDHVSLNWSGLQGFSIGGLDTHNITFQHGLIAESKTGALFGDTNPEQTGFSYDNTFRTTLFYGIPHRTPNAAGGRVDIYNNVRYDWRNRLSVITNGAQVNHFNNYTFTGDKTTLFTQWQTQTPVWQVEAGTNNNPAIPFLIWTQGNIVQDLFEDPNAINKDTLWIEHAVSGQTERLADSFFTDTQFTMIGAVPANILTGLEASIAIPVDAGAYKYLNADGSVGVYRDEADTKYVANTISDTPDGFSCCNSGPSGNRHTAIESSTYLNFHANLNSTPINTRPNDFYVSNDHIPEAYLTARGITGNATVHNDVQVSGYTLLEEYINQVDGDVIIEEPQALSTAITNKKRLILITN